MPDNQLPPPPGGATWENRSRENQPTNGMPQWQAPMPSPHVPSQPYTMPLAPGPDTTPTRPLQRGEHLAPATPQPYGGVAMGTPPPPPAPPRKRQGGISRRTVLIGAGVGAVGLGAVGAGVGITLSHLNQGPHALASDAGKIGHLLRRAGFGPTPADGDLYLKAGVSGTLDRLINYTSVPDTLTARLASMQFDFTTEADLARWFTLRMIYSTRPLEEKMTLFWSGVLTSSYQKIGGKLNYPLLVKQNQMLREKGMGRFDDLIRAISIDPAMLWYLDGRLSTGHAPNENYGRELMELFTMGIGNYTQDDVHQAALALAGWVIQNGTSVLVPNRQYTGNVTLLGKTGKLGLDEVVALVCAHPATGKHLAYRLWSFFVYENPSDDDLKPLVDAYYRSNHSIRAVVQAMFTSSAFFSAKAYRARMKSPAEFVVGAIRGLGIETNGQGLGTTMASMGQILFDPPDVSGWDGDKVSGNWLSTQGWMNRLNYINTLLGAASGMGSGTRRASATPGTTGNAPSALQAIITARQLRTPQEVADHFIATLLDDAITADRRAVLHDAITSAPATTPTFTLAGNATVPAEGVRSALYLLMGSPEYTMN